MAPVLSRPLRLACPCIGWDAPGHAFRRLGQPVEILYAYDTDVRVYKPLVALHGRAVVDRFCLGPYVGDICAVDYSNWECVDAIIAGPPSPLPTLVLQSATASEMWWPLIHHLREGGLSRPTPFQARRSKRPSFLGL